MFASLEFDKPCSSDSIGHVAASRTRRDRIRDPVEDERRNPDRSEQWPNVDEAICMSEPDGSRRACGGLIISRASTCIVTIGVNTGNEDRRHGSPIALEFLDPLINFIRWITERIVVATDKGRLGAAEDEAQHALGIRHSKHDRERTTLAPAHHMGARQAGRVHHSARVLHAFVGSRDSRRSIAQSRTALIEANETRERRHPIAPANPRWLLPVKRQVRHPPGNHQNLVPPVADRLVRNADTSVLRIRDRRRHTPTLRP